MAKTPVIKTVNLCKYYQMGKTTVRANQKINMEIYSGEFIIIFGPSGCGKSTLLSLLAGLDEPTSGEIIIRGEKLNNLNSTQLAKYRRTKVGMVFQQYNLVKTMTASENVALPLAFDGKPKRFRSQRALSCLEMVGLADQKDHTPAELSGGQQQKVAIARAWVAVPWIVLADEPTGNLDSKSSDDIIHLLKNLNKKSKRTVILVSHNPEYIKYADRVIYLKDGVVAKATGKTKRVSREKKPKSDLELLEIEPKIKRALKRAGFKSAEDFLKVRIADLAKIRGIDDIEAAKIQKEATKLLEKEGKLVSVAESFGEGEEASNIPSGDNLPREDDLTSSRNLSGEDSTTSDDENLDNNKDKGASNEV